MIIHVMLKKMMRQVPSFFCSYFHMFTSCKVTQNIPEVEQVELPPGTVWVMEGDRFSLRLVKPQMRRKNK